MMRSVLVVAVFLAGCTGAGSAADSGTGPTWYEDVLPITQKQCANCHAVGGIAPFPLETYEQAKALATMMKSAVTERRMPPWMPSGDCGGTFRDERRLTQAEIDVIAAWADSGAREGDASKAPPAPAPLGVLPRIDATVAMPEAYTPTRSLSDDYRCFLIDPGLTSTKQLTGYDILPGNRAVVHHVIMYLVDKANAERADREAAGPGWTCFGASGVRGDGPAVGAWAPGSPSVIFPAGTGITLEAGKAFAMQVHYNTAGGTGSDLTTVKLMYATSPVTGAYLLPVVDDDFSIPPGATGYSHSKDFENTLPINVRIWGLLPHMHTKGARITLTAGPNSTDTCLVDVPRWDFRWQQQYYRPTAFELKPSEKFRINCSWNNPTSRTITWGEGTDDEMCFAYVYATP
ncbi:MAG: hypothetical protein JNG84_09455 [Archangium sp.]|nr:hypothetical protein [Archangium sp.]